jgi:uncharacterized protein YfaS (alpha-2-macroglobulin family)
MRALFFALAALAITACHSGTPDATATLAPVEPAPSATPQGPIASFAPTGLVDTLSQIRVIFRDDLIPLEALESPDENAVLAKFSIVPALPGHFHVLTPRMIGFQADAALPLATRVRVTIAAGLRDMHGKTLDHDFSWTFNTAPIVLADLPLQSDTKASPEPGPLDPKIVFSANTGLDMHSLAAHGSLVPDSGGAAVGLIAPASAAPSSSPTPPPGASFDPSEKAFTYTLVPAQPLAKGTIYRVVFAPGIVPVAGNQPSSDTFTGRVRTYGRLTFDGLTQDKEDYDRIDSGTPRLAFSNPIDPKTLGAVHVSPAPATGTAVGKMGDYTIGINPALLAPNTTYTVTIDATLADTFGQTLGTAERATFRTTDLKKSLWAPAGTSLFPSSLKVALNVTAVNIPNGSAQATFAKLAPADMIQYSEPFDASSPLFQLPGAASVPVNVAAPANTERTVALPLRARAGGTTGVVAYHVTGPTMSSGSDVAGLVQLTNLGTFAQWFPDSGFVRVDHLADGAPAPNVQIDIYRSQTGDKDKSAVTPCATGHTGADGVARFSGAGYATCAALDNGANTAPSFVTIAREGADWAYVRTDDSTGSYASGLFSGWSSGTPIAQGTIFSDRDLYQPGETAQLTAVGWFLTHGILARGRAANYTVVLQLPNQEKRTLPRMTLNAYGTASIPIAIGKNAPLGYYNVHVSAGNGETIDGSFRVAQFKPPNFSVALALPRTTAIAGESVAANTTSMYLFGAPVAGASTYYEVTRSLTNYTWSKDPAYTFGRQWFWPENTPSVSSDVIQRTVTVDGTGHSTTDVPVAADLPYPMTYRVDADTTDVANLSVGDSKSFTAFPGPVQIGVKNAFVATAGSPANITIVALDPAGAVAPTTSVHVELQSATYLDATAVVEGGDTPEQSVTYTTVASTDIDSGTAPVVAQLTPPKAGAYRIRANIAGAKSDATETDTQLYVTGSDDVAWGGPDPNIVQIHLDKTTYNPGDIAHAIVQSPFPDADIMVAVIRNGVMWQQRISTRNRAPSIAFTITPDMLPNAAFEAIAVRRGALPQAAAVDSGNAVERSGFASFNVALDAKYLTVTAVPQHARMHPGDHQVVRLHLTDKAKRPVRGQVTLIVANDAVLQLSGYRPPDLVQQIYGNQPISTRFADNRSTIVLQTAKKYVDKGWGFGGGLSTGAEDTRIRKKFDALAYYNASIITDADGNATASFDLPDDLTTWRVMAVAASADGRFGNGEATFLTNKPVAINPVVPQFARPGDTFMAGITLSSEPGITGTVAGSGSLTGPLAFLTDGKQSAATTFSAPIDQITKAYRFGMIARGPGTSTVTFSAKRNGAPGGDAFAIPVAVIDRAVMESVITTGVLPNGNVAIPLTVAPGTPTDSGGLQLMLANSLIPDAVIAAQAAFAEDDRVAIGAAGRLTIAADLVKLAALTNTTAIGDARAQAATATAFLITLQRPDGGFASFPGATMSDPFDSLDVLHAFSRANAAGFPVNPKAFAAAMNYAATILNDPSTSVWCAKEPCKSQMRLHALDALSDAGDVRTSFLGDIDAQHDSFDLADQIRLARLLLVSPSYKERGAAEAHALNDRVYITGATAMLNTPARYAWFTKPVVAQSQMTRLLLAQHADATVLDRLTRSLLALRTNGSWGCACQNAAALDALVDLARAAGPPANANASVTLGTASLAHVAFFDHKTGSRNVHVPPAQLPAGPNTLAIATNPGPLHYAVTYSYRVTGDQRGRLSGLRVTRIVHPAGATSAFATMGLAALTAPVETTAAKVFDIELQVITDHPIDRVQITDSLPAGMEAVDTSFKTSNAARPAQSWQIDDQQIYHDRIEAYADYLGPGVYTLHYLARTVTPGTFSWPGAQARLIDRPEEFGRSATATLVVK